MTRSGIDADALIRQLSEATAKQGDAVRESVQQATLTHPGSAKPSPARR